MKQVSNGLLDQITNDYHNEVGVIVHAEWPMNKMYNTAADNTPSEDDEAYDIEYFPIESITDQHRPTSGICKAIVNQSFVEPNYRSEVPSARFYTVDADDEYQYWQSPLSADEAGIFPLFTAANFPQPPGETYNYDNQTCVRPEVAYVTEEDAEGEFEPITVEANKITFTVENTFAYPTDYDIQVRYTTGGAWATVASNITIPSNGRVNLWYNGTNWSTTQNLSSQRTVSAVRLVVRAMDKKAYFNLIELGLCLERNLSSDVVAWNTSFTMGERDFITPLGNISSNSGQVTLFNGDEDLYRNDNEFSPYYNLLDKGVRFKVWMTYGNEAVQQLEMFSERWEESDDQTLVSLVDESYILMEAKPRAFLYRSIPVQEAVWRICDAIGFNKYQISPTPIAPEAPVYTETPTYRGQGFTSENQEAFEQRLAAYNETMDAYDAALKAFNAHPGVIDIFWADGQKTAWELFAELSRATQTAIYFDSFGFLQVKTRDAAWKAHQPSDYSFLRESVPGGQPANIVSLMETTEYEANKVTVNWQPTGFSETRDNIVPFEVVWEPEGSVVMRATELAKNLLIGEEVVYLQTKEGKTWPWKGIMNLEGEWISFDAKRYVHYDEGGERKTSWVSDYEEQKKHDERGGPFYRHMNHYTGALRIEQRGIWGTEETNHTIDIDGWTKTRRRNYSTNVSPCPGIKLNTARSSLTIENQKNMQLNDYTYLHRGTSFDQGYRYLGTRMRIDKGAFEDKVGGIFFGGDDGLGSGYFLEVMATAKMNGKTRGNRNEVMFYSMKPDGSKKVFGGQTVKMRDKSKDDKKGSVKKEDIGARLAVPLDRYIDFDIWVAVGNDADVIQVFANGRKLMTATVPQGTWRHGNVSRMGLFARGHSKVTFDYVYAINSPGAELLDSESYFDRIEGGYYSTQANDWTFDITNARRKVKKRRKKRRKGKKWKWEWKKYEQKYKQRLFDDFGPVAHEVREFDVKFNNSLPVLESKLYFSNDTQAVCTEFTGDATGANFIMANTSRLPAVINGDDDRTSMGNGTINHKLFVYGRPVIQKDAQEIIKEDAWSVRRRGIIELEYASPWIQNQDEADRFSTWLTTHWTGSDSTVEVEVFGNPLMELGDTVQVSYKHIDAMYWVVGISNTYEQGLTTNLTLRKARDLS